MKPETKKETKAWGITSMVVGIVSLLFAIMPYFGLPLAIMAIVFSGIQKKKYGDNGYATAGLVCGIIGIVVNAIVLLIVGLVFLFSLSLLS